MRLAFGRGAQPSLERATPHDYDSALRGWLLSGLDTEHVTDAHRNAARRVGANLNGKTMTLRLAPHAMRSLDARDVAEWEKRAAIGVGSGSIGGYTVADTMMGALEKALLAFGGMRSVATVIRTATGSDMPIPTSDDTSNKGALLAENTQVSEVDITFSQLVLQAYKYSSKSVLVSQEFLQDSSINVNEFIGNALGERIARIQNDNFTTGTGSSQPNGIITAATSSSITFTGSATVSYDNLVDLVHSVDPAYRMNGKFMFHDGALKMLKKVKVLQSLRPFTGARVARDVVRGQFEGYRQAHGVAPDSSTETFVGIRALVDNWRWSGVPFLLRTGKAMRGRFTEVVLRFRTPPFDLLQPRRTITGMSAVLLPFLDPATPDIDGFLAHLVRTVEAGLVPAINMDTGFGPTIGSELRSELLRLARGSVAGEVVAGADTGEDAVDRAQRRVRGRHEAADVREQHDQRERQPGQRFDRPEHRGEPGRLGVDPGRRKGTAGAEGLRIELA